ncbi:TetR/AcrR family transcriptional regulator [Caulobacter sp. CCUG 60055]|nr:TetR/AcrR family transcriptional regulator [Caulobacter sp. CCUG 60055]MCI3181994.1 TetR/AcrR family transcriptional regulator [Caulobacter sp. CCUG 60055]
MANDRVTAWRRRQREDARPRFTREDWLRAARKALIRGGVASVKVERLAADLAITRGGFYWHFKDRKDLLDGLLADWVENNTEPLIKAIENDQPDGVAQYRALVKTWLDERRYSPAYDSAVRDWARLDSKVAQTVRRIDEQRIRAVANIFLNLGYEMDEAMIRARVTYYHQVGYYALAIKESKAARLQGYQLYSRVLIGRDSEA